MPLLTIVADIHAVPEQADLVRTELQRLIAPTRAEAGCIRYDLHQDDKDPAHFLFFEIWESRDLWRAHVGSPHLAAFKDATKSALTEMIVSEMSRIG